MENIKSLKGIAFDLIFKSFNKAFKDYEMQLTKQELLTMINRRGFVPELSFAAFENDEIVAFTLNGIGIFNGLKTAYDTGTGTIEEFRGQGLASKIFSFSIPFLKKAAVAQYLLEVLQHNTTAVSVYKKLGFEISREFNYYIQNAEASLFQPKAMKTDYHIEEFKITHNKSFVEFWDFNPSWQNSIE